MPNSRISNVEVKMRSEPLEGALSGSPEINSQFVILSSLGLYMKPEIPIIPPQKTSNEKQCMLTENGVYAPFVV